MAISHVACGQQKNAHISGQQWNMCDNYVDKTGTHLWYVDKTGAHMWCVDKTGIHLWYVDKTGTHMW